MLQPALLSLVLLVPNLCSELALPQEVGTGVELGSVQTQLVFADEREWLGKLRIFGSLPDTEGGQSVVLEVLLPGEGNVFVIDGMWPGVYVSKPGSRERVDGSDLFQVVAFGQVSPEGTFKLPFVQSAPPRSLFRIRPNGRFLSGSGLHFKLDDASVPDFTKPLVVKSKVGYAAELRLHLPKDATARERSALAGRKLSFRGESKGRFASSEYEAALEPAATIEEPKDTLRGPLLARMERIGLQRLSFQPPIDTANIEDCLAPFYVSAIRQIEPSEGQEVIVDVQLERGIVLAGIVVDTAGRPLDRARVDVVCTRLQDPVRPSEASYLRFFDQGLRVTTDADGKFIARAVPADFAGIEVYAPNKLYHPVSAAQIPAADRSNLRLVVE